MSVTEKEIKQFYNSASWRWTRKAKLCKDPLCEACAMSQVVTAASEVHHTKPVRLFWDDRFNIKFLVSLCTPCHTKIEDDIRLEQKARGG